MFGAVTFVTQDEKQWPNAFPFAQGELFDTFKQNRTYQVEFVVLFDLFHELFKAQLNLFSDMIDHRAGILAYREYAFNT